MKNWISFSIKLDNGKVFPVQTQKCDGIWPHTQILPLSLSRSFARFLCMKLLILIIFSHLHAKEVSARWPYPVNHYQLNAFQVLQNGRV